MILRKNHSIRQSAILNKATLGTSRDYSLRGIVAFENFVVINGFVNFLKLFPYQNMLKSELVVGFTIQHLFMSLGMIASGS